MADHESFSVMPPSMWNEKFSLLSTFMLHHDTGLYDRISATNNAMSEVLLELVSKLRADPALQSSDLRVDELSKTLDDATEVEIEYYEEEICELLGRAFLTRKFPNLHKLLLREEKHYRCVLESIASGHFPNLDSLSLLDLRALDEKESALITRALDGGQLSNLKSLDLRDNGIGDETLEALKRASEGGRLCSLEVLRLQQERFWTHSEESDDDSDADEKHGRCLSLDESYLDCTPAAGAHRVGDEGAKALAEALKSGKLESLRYLELCISSDKIGSTGIAAVASVLEQGLLPLHAQLKTLRLASVTKPIPREGTDALAKALSSERMTQAHLEEVCLGNFEKGEAIASALASRQFPALGSLFLVDLGLREEAAAAIARAVQLNRLPALRVLNLTDNNLGEEGVKAIATGFKSGNASNLEGLHFSLKGPGDEDVVALAAVLAGGYLPNLKVLELPHIYGPSGAEAMLTAYRDNPSLTLRLETSWPIGRPWYRTWSELWSRNINWTAYSVCDEEDDDDEEDSLYWSDGSESYACDIAMDESEIDYLDAREVLSVHVALIKGDI